MHSVWSRIWTRVAVSNSYDDNHYTTITPLLYVYISTSIYLSIYLSVPVNFFLSFFLSFFFSMFISPKTSVRIYCSVYLTRSASGFISTVCIVFVSGFKWNIRFQKLFIKAERYNNEEKIFSSPQLSVDADKCRSFTLFFYLSIYLSKTHTWTKSLLTSWSIKYEFL